MGYIYSQKKRKRETNSACQSVNTQQRACSRAIDTRIKGLCTFGIRLINMQHPKALPPRMLIYIVNIICLAIINITKCSS